MSTKICSCCKLTKETTKFFLNKARKDGFDQYCKECRKIKKYKSKYNSKAHAKANAKWRARNPTYFADYAPRRDPAKMRAAVNMRRKAFRRATPKWLTRAQIKEIRQIYLMAQELSWLSDGGLEVDHIMPLRGKNSCGLHVPWNLQIVPTAFNRTKGNKELI